MSDHPAYAKPKDVRVKQPATLSHGAGLESSSSVAVDAIDFKEIADHVYDGIYITDGAGQTLYVNKAFTRMTSVSLAEIQGRRVHDIVAEGLFENAVAPEVIRLKRQVNSMSGVPRAHMKMLVTGTPIFDEAGDIKYVVVIGRELSRLNEVRAELEASREKMEAIEEDAEKKLREIKHLRAQQRMSGLIGDSHVCDMLREQIEQIANLDVTVLLVGESGSGKEVVANEIHQHAARRGGPFIKVNCSAIPANLLEAELFGYEKGAFTGAAPTGRIGLFELADHGMILLDEIGEMPLELQSKLLRVIQHKEVTRIGGRKPTPLDVRIIAATNVDLKEQVARKLFREDLFYRINVFPIEIPPLRERKLDIIALSKHFSDIYNDKYNKNVTFVGAAFDALCAYPWPGNVRELQNIIERLIIISMPSDAISEKQLRPLLGLAKDEFPLRSNASLKEIVGDFEQKVIERAIETYGTLRKAAKALDVDQSTLVKKRKAWAKS